MDYFPVFLNLHDRPCLVVGGGDVALRKARRLLQAGARIFVIAEETSPTFQRFVDDNGLPVTRRRFRPSDVDDQWLVVAATDDAIVQKDVFDASTAAGVFCNAVDDQANCSFITPAIIDRDPIIVAISSGGAAPVLARKLKSRIEQLLPQDLGRLASLAGQWRDRVAHRLGGFRTRRRFWESVFDGPASLHAIGGHIDKAEREMARLLVNFENETDRQGEAWLVGAGPGDPDLLTLKAVQIMQAADVIVHDRLVSNAVLDLARRDAELISVGKSPGCRINSQQEINRLLVRLVRSGKTVCRLKGGDPFIFGRGGEELQALAGAGLSCGVVPGITAAAGCAASAGIPLTHRDVSQSVVFVTAHGTNSVDKLDWISLARDRQTLVFYMGVARFPELMKKLIRNGRAAGTPIAIIERGTTPQQRVIRGSLGQLAMLADAQRIEAPAVLVIGEVAALGHTIVQENVVPSTPGNTQPLPIYAKQTA